MRIVIDLQGAQNESRHRGIGRYSLALAKAVVRNRGRHEVFIALNSLFPKTIEEIKNSFIGLLPESNVIVFHAAGPVAEFGEENFWRQRTAELSFEKFISDLSPDLLLVSSLFEGAIDNTITSIGQLFSNVATATILYDLIPYSNPDKYIGWPPAKNWYYRKIDALKRSDLLLAISNSARREAIDYLTIDGQRIINIASAADTSFTKANLTPSSRSKLLGRYGIKSKFLMHASAFDERKNFEGLIKAFAALPKYLQRDFQLVLVCKIDDAVRNSLDNLAATLGLRKNDLVLTGYVPDDDLIQLYSECHLFVFPSLHEGFGLPALEAMCCGAATIGSNSSSIPEVIGRQDALFDPKSTESMAAVIERALNDKDFWQSLKDHAAIQALKFSWDQSANIAIEGFEKLHAKKITRTPVISRQAGHAELIERIALIKSGAKPSEQDFIDVADAIDKNENSARRMRALADFGGRLKWRIEGPFDSTYSLALLNRETARALEELGHFVILHSTEGPGDFPANQQFLAANPDIALMHARVVDYPHSAVDVTSRNLYPPRVEDMQGPLNLLHHYAWEESGFPQSWVENFNKNLHGITCLSNHVEKILVDNGVSVPMLTSGCGVDHWERIHPEAVYEVKAKEFRFLHVSSCFPRKGVELLLDAYAKSFSSDDDVTLIIKTFANPHNEIHKWLEDRRQENPQFPDVLIIESDLSDSELKALYQRCDVLVSPSRAEGFGLPMAEAMLSGLPVITTAWGGQLDFCNEDNSWLVDYQFERAKTHFGLFTSVWAKIDVDGLASALRQAHRSPKEHLAAKALAGRKRLLEEFKWVDVVGRAVDACHTWRAVHDKHPEVKIGWITTWNTKCGIATYSEHLISSMPADVTVLAPFQEALLNRDGDNCVRSWQIGKDNNNLNQTAEYISEKNINALVIQFNYGFFNHRELSKFIEGQLDEGRAVIVMMHSTVDPVEKTPAWNFRLVEMQSILMRCDRILVHSVPDLNRLKAIGLIDNVALFPHGVLNYASTGSVENKSKFPLIASYGFCLPHKGLVELVQAAGLLKKQGQPIRLRLVNAEYPIAESAELVQQLKDLIKKLGIDDLVEMHSDFLEDNESLSLLSEADVVVFAYQQTGESASGAVRYGLATKRPIAVTPLSIFEDIGDAAFRFPGTSSEDIADGISECLRELSTNSERAQYIQAKAQQWREQHDYSAVSMRLLNICAALVRQHPPRAHHFHGSSPFLKTAVGNIQGKNLVSTGVSGNLVHGPYLALAAGKYRVVIRGVLGETGAAAARMDVAIDKGNLILAESVLGEPVADGCLVSLPIALDAPCSDLEVRVWVDDDTDLTVLMISIEPWQGNQDSGEAVPEVTAIVGEFLDQDVALAEVEALAEHPEASNDDTASESLPMTSAVHNQSPPSSTQRNQAKSKRKKRR